MGVAVGVVTRVVGVAGLEVVVTVRKNERNECQHYVRDSSGNNIGFHEYLW